ncbi:MAG TPA: phosphoribosylformylglycinamidine synthase subunit PurQ, partial [Verrucomicrobiae bacterium]|nr:phosphoribosylformylglycinamidine synthase subunit PurQ [Verrucomicrobiae bacterium]
MNFAVLQFPGSNCDQDVVHVLRNVFGHSARLLWHKDASVGDADAIIIPGGFSYGDYLRTGAIARFSPVMGAVQRFAAAGGLVLGICNGFQILCEAGLLPGALIRNRSLQFRCEHVFLSTETTQSPFTCQVPAGQLLRIPIAHGEGCY